MVVHFKSAKERLAYIKGNFEEIVPVEAKEEKPKAEPKKKAKKGKKDNDKVQAK